MIEKNDVLEEELKELKEKLEDKEKRIELCVSIIKNAKVGKPMCEKDEEFYRIKKAILEEFKEILLSTLKSIEK